MSWAAFDENGVLQAQASEPVQDGAAADASAYDDDTRPVDH